MLIDKKRNIDYNKNKQEFAKGEDMSYTIYTDGSFNPISKLRSFCSVYPKS